MYVARGKNCACSGLVLTATERNQIGDNDVNASLRGQMALPPSVAVGGCFQKLSGRVQFCLKLYLSVLTIWISSFV